MTATGSNQAKGKDWIYLAQEVRDEVYSYSRYNDGLSDIEGGNHLRAGVGLSGGTMLTFNRLRFDTLTRKFVFYIKDSLSWNQSLLPHVGRRGDGLDFVQLTVSELKSPKLLFYSLLPTQTRRTKRFMSLFQNGRKKCKRLEQIETVSTHNLT